MIKQINAFVDYSTFELLEKFHICLLEGNFAAATVRLTSTMAWWMNAPISCCVFDRLLTWEYKIWTIQNGIKSIKHFTTQKLAWLVKCNRLKDPPPPSQVNNHIKNFY